jgi:hypothetical protein
LFLCSSFHGLICCSLKRIIISLLHVFRFSIVSVLISRSSSLIPSSYWLYKNGIFTNLSEVDISIVYFVSNFRFTFDYNFMRRVLFFVILGKIISILPSFMWMTLICPNLGVAEAVANYFPSIFNNYFQRGLLRFIVYWFSAVTVFWSWLFWKLSNGLKLLSLSA